MKGRSHHLIKEHGNKEEKGRLRALGAQLPIAIKGTVENSVLLKCRKLRREDQETSDWIVSRILYFIYNVYPLCRQRRVNIHL